MKTKIKIDTIEVAYKKVGKEDYICLTDMAKFKNEEIPAHVISHWLSTKFAIDFLGIWEKTNNPDFKLTEFREFRNESGGSFTLSPKQWIEKTNAIGIISSAGRYGGTYAHKDIAFEFATWLSAEFKFWIIKEFQRLKEQEQALLSWSAKRELAKINYHIHTGAIKENLIVPELSKGQVNFVYANEADMLNVALFGKTASQWRQENPNLKGNIRDYATLHQLLVLANMESSNAEMLHEKVPQKERIVKLNKMAKRQLLVLLETKNPLLLETESPNTDKE
ncbi:MAG: KilA-N domain-containing protein [Firmicutes bacterium]|nr:KilA-N domain-containing protein [Bacillota bacterium]